MIRKQGISVDEVQLAFVRMWEAPSKNVNILSSIKAQKSIQPLLNWIVHAIPDWLIKADFKQGSPSIERIRRGTFLVHNSCLILLSETLNQL